MKKWNILSKSSIKNSVSGIGDIIKILLENRGIQTADIDAYLHPKLEDITLDSVEIDKKAIKKTLQRIETALKKQEQIIIYGDYDVDGITASAILWETLYTLKAQVTPYIPHRIEEGYGLSIIGINNLKREYPTVSLVITVDNGIVANEAVEFAKKESIDVIITDHHVPSDKLPDAFSIVHTTKLSGAGIAWLLAREIKNYTHRHPEPASWRAKDLNRTAKDSSAKPQNDRIGEDDNLLELAALGTIADLVPLKGANRTIVKFGLEKLTQTKRPGLIELFREAGINGADIGVYEVGHIIAPRLNATGRMKSAMDSLRLLCTKNRDRALELAALLGTTNRERQSVMLEATKHASLSVHARQGLKKLLIVSHDTYPEGVIGLVAGRLVEEFYRPSIVISRGEKLSKGSVRSISGFNIIEFLRQSSEYFVNIGGHPMAAGFTIETEKIEQMTEALEKFAHELMEDGLFKRTIKIDCEITLSLATNSFYSAIQKLSPFGMGNPEPMFVSRNLIIEDLRLLGKDNKHLRLTVRGENAEMNAIAFGFGEIAKTLHTGDKIDLAYTLDENRWNGKTTLQLKVKDIANTNK